MFSQIHWWQIWIRTTFCSLCEHCISKSIHIRGIIIKKAPFKPPPWRPILTNMKISKTLSRICWGDSQTCQHRVHKILIFCSFLKSTYTFINKLIRISVLFASERTFSRAIGKFAGYRVHEWNMQSRKSKRISSSRMKVAFAKKMARRRRIFRMKTKIWFFSSDWNWRTLGGL